jgi:hypothetical protein
MENTQRHEMDEERFKIRSTEKKYLRVETTKELVHKRKAAKIKNLIFRDPICQNEHGEDCGKQEGRKEEHWKSLLHKLYMY